MDMGSLMWDEAVRDQQAETTELARTAAVTEAGASVWPLLALAADRGDLGHRLALAAPSLRAIAARRGYDEEALVGDMTRRWELLEEARQAELARTAAVRERKAEAGRQSAERMQTVAVLTARAARDNPGLPMEACQRLAEDTLTRHAADAYPLAYESFGYVGDGPVTQRAKDWQPPSAPSKKPPGPNTGAEPDPSDDGPGGQTSLFPEPDRTEPSAPPEPDHPAAATVPDGPGGQTGLFPEPDRPPQQGTLF